MHRYLVVSMTFRGKYAVAGFTFKPQAEAYLRIMIADRTIYDAQILEP